MSVIGQSLTLVAGIMSAIQPSLRSFTGMIPAGTLIENTLTVGSRQKANCYNGNGFYDAELGNFRRYSNHPCLPSPCPPESPAAIGTRFLLTTKDGTDSFIRIGDDNARRRITARKVIVFIHGWTNDYRIDPYLNQTRSNWLARGVDYITVDWSQGNAEYDASAANTRTLGAQIGQLLDYLNIVQKTECIGFSFGAHACGFVGQWLKRRRNKTLPECTAIDPASKRFEGCPANMRLDSSDCNVVKVIHSSYLRSMLPTSFGITQKVGNCDFYVRYNAYRPGCPYMDFNNLYNTITAPSRFAATFQTMVACNHIEGMHMYNRQLRSGGGRGRITGVQCTGPVTDCSVLANETRTMAIPPFDTCSSNQQINMCICP